MLGCLGEKLGELYQDGTKVYINDDNNDDEEEEEDGNHDDDEDDDTLA